MNYAITIDGTSGCGKSTLAKNLQKKLKAFVLVDTGAYYRWATHLCQEANIDINNKTKVYNHTKNQLELNFVPYKGAAKYHSAKVMYMGEDINKKIRANKVTKEVPIIAQYPKIRQLVKKKIRELAKRQNVIVAGRDIGTEVLPEAQIKFFLNSSVDARARRRYRDEVKQGKATSYGDLKKSLGERDKIDSEREHGPLKKPKDAYEIDNTFYTASQTLNEALKYIYKKEPGIKDIKISNKISNSQFSISNKISNDKFQMPKSEEKTESIKELKKRLKAKYKSSQGGGGTSFFSKH